MGKISNKFIGSYDTESMVVFSLLFIVLYVIISYEVFAFRHPWATNTERLLYTKEALTFQYVPYKQMREGY